MRWFLRIAGIIFVAGLFTLIALIWFAPALTSTPAFLDANGKPLANSIASVEWPIINGARQFLLIRGKNINNPVLLFIHGGPGIDETPWFRTFNSPLEEYFTVVYWVQRGSSKNWDPFADQSLIKPSIIFEDARQLATMLKERFSQRPIFVVGHSWGAAIGLELADSRPSLVAAYVGVGQLTNMQHNEKHSWEWTLAQARAANDITAVNELLSMGEYPQSGEFGRDNYNQKAPWLAKFGGSLYKQNNLNFFFNHFTGPEYGLTDIPRYLMGLNDTLVWIWDPLLKDVNFEQAPMELQVPIYLVSGRYDQEVPLPLVQSFYETLKAPHKQLVIFDESAHSPLFEEAAAFNRFMVETVLADNRSNFKQQKDSQ